MSLNPIKIAWSLARWKHSDGSLARTWIKPRSQALRYHVWNLFIDIVFSANSASDRNSLLHTKWSGTWIIALSCSCLLLYTWPFAFPFWLFFGCFNFFPFVAASHPCTTTDISVYGIILRAGGGDPMDGAEPNVRYSEVVGARAGCGAGDGGA